MYIWYVLGLFFVALAATHIYDYQQDKKKSERGLFKKNSF